MPERHADLRRRELERHRDRLDLRRARHVQEVQGARASRASVPVGAVDPRAFSTDELRDGWRLACRAPARGDLVIDVPPLQTRPKAALVGVGRHVILRPVGAEAPPRARGADAGGPALGRRSACSTRSTTSSRASSCAVLRTLGKVLREAHFDVTAVVCDEELIDVEPGDTTARRFAIAFDLGTTTVVATLLDLETGTPAAVRSMLNRQQPYGADVITRVSATMLDEGALDALEARAHETLAAARRGGRARRRGVDPARGLRDRRRRQRDDDPARARHRPRAAVDGAVHRHHARPAAGRWRPTSASPCTRARRPSCSRRSAPTSAATSSPACSPPASRATSGCGCSSTSARTARSRSASTSACSPPPRPPARRSRRRRSAAACAPPTARSRA